MKIKKIGTKLSLLVVSSILSVTVTSLVGMYFGMAKVADQIINETSTAAVDGVFDEFENYKTTALDLASRVASDSDVLAAIEEGDKSQLAMSVQMVSERARADTQFITVTDSKGVIISSTDLDAEVTTEINSSASATSTTDKNAVDDKAGLANMNIEISDKVGETIADQQSVTEALAGDSVAYIESTADIKMGICAAVPITNDSGKVIGVVSTGYGLDNNQFVDNLKVVTGTEFTIFLNNERINTTLMTDGKRVIGTTLDEKIAKVVLEQKQNYSHEIDFIGQRYYAVYKPILNDNGDAIGAVFSGKLMDNVVKTELIIYAMIFGAIVIVSLITILITNRIIKKAITKPIEQMSILASQLSNGNLHASELDYHSHDEIGALADSLSYTVRTLSNYVEDISSNLNLMAGGDLTAEISQNYLGDFSPIKDSLVKISTGLNQTLSTIKLSSEQVNSGSDQVSNGAQALSQGATEQASSMQELSASILDISTQVNANMENVSIASKYVGLAGQGITESNDHMKNMVIAMTDINQSSNEIAKINKVIDDIAFQTNILALNAAVEAARAGAAGKGFAVVADEVRNLASKSAEAAKQTTALIEASIKSVNKGTKIAEETAESLVEVAVNANLVAINMDKVAKASDEQAVAINQISLGIEQISAVIQTNSATAEESAAASEELSGQAATLNREIERFKLLNTKNSRPSDSIFLDDTNTDSELNFTQPENKEFSFDF